MILYMDVVFVYRRMGWVQVDVWEEKGMWVALSKQQGGVQRMLAFFFGSILLLCGVVGWMEVFARWLGGVWLGLTRTGTERLVVYSMVSYGGSALLDCLVWILLGARTDKIRSSERPLI